MQTVLADLPIKAISGDEINSSVPLWSTQTRSRTLSPLFLPPHPHLPHSVSISLSSAQRSTPAPLGAQPQPTESSHAEPRPAMHSRWHRPPRWVIPAGSGASSPTPSQRCIRCHVSSGRWHGARLTPAVTHCHVPSPELPPLLPVCSRAAPQIPHRKDCALLSCPASHQQLHRLEQTQLSRRAAV